jgi:predicted phage terminase large subunit-like protein
MAQLTSQIQWQDITRERIQRERIRRSLLRFTLATRPDYRANWHHEMLAAALDRVAQGQCPRLMVFLPPQHGKSELVSRRFPAFVLGNDPELRLIQASHTHDLAVSMNRAVQRIIASEAYQRIFPRTRLNDRRASDHFSSRRTQDFFEVAGHAGSLRSAGVGNSIAGNPADGAIIDDPFGKREDADSPVMRQRVWDWYANDLHTRLSTRAWIVLTHTRWHRDDLAGRLLRKMADRGGDQWQVLNLPAVREDNAPGLYGGGPIDPRQLGEALWPDFKSKEDLEIIRRQDARAFAALYQQNPTDGTEVEWAAEFFGDWMWVPPEKWPQQLNLRVVCVDASKGASDKLGDYCAIVFLGYGGDGLLYVDAVMERFPLDQIVRKTIQFCDEKQPQFVGFEAEQFQELLVHEFRRQCASRSPVRWPIYSMRTMGIPKVSRIRRLSQYVVNRELRFRADSPGCRLLVDQLMDFPHAEHDDGPDALEMCTRLPSEATRMIV